MKLPHETQPYTAQLRTGKPLREAQQFASGHVCWRERALIFEFLIRCLTVGAEVERILDDFILSLRKLFQRLTFDLFHTHVSDNFLF